MKLNSIRTADLADNDRPHPDWFLMLAIALDLCFLLTYSLCAIQLIRYLILTFCGFPSSVNWEIWIFSLPIIYYTWLILFLSICAFEIQARRYLLRMNKKMRASAREHFFLYYLTLSLYNRYFFFKCLPMVRHLQVIPLINQLFFYAYAHQVHIGRDTMILGYLFDPDLIFIENEVIIGTDAILIAHSLTIDQLGMRVITTSPVMIKSRVVIGGGARIEPGVFIGENSLIEPGSVVTAFTRINPHEVWGGNPARFVRIRESYSAEIAPQNETPIKYEPDSFNRETINIAHEIVAQALHTSINEIHADLSSFTCAGWDSMAQLDMGLQLEKRVGIKLSPLESLRLRNTRDLYRIIQNHQQHDA